MMEDIYTQTSDSTDTRKPCVALMGEFSAGKSTLTNLLLGESPLPVKVTATRLPPIMLSYGAPAAVRETLDGDEVEIDPSEIADVDLAETRLVRLYLEADILQVCDIMDMPGISDPNMSSEVWRDVIGLAHSVIWCTHATQAWRQSEAAAWDLISGDLGQNNLLLITRFDKITTGRDRARILARIRKETAGLFSDVFAISLTEAIAADEDREKWEASGADAFINRLIEMMVDPDAPSWGTYDGNTGPSAESAAPEAPASLCERKSRSDAPKVMPTRISPSGKKQPRPAADDAPSDILIALSNDL